MRKRAGKRKVNYASDVKRTMPITTVGRPRPGASNRQYMPLSINQRRKKMLDNISKCYIIIFTVGAAVSVCVPHAGERSQTRSIAATRNFKPTTSRCHRSTVCQRQLLRSQRSRPGQVRDAAPRAERGSLGDWRRDGFRLLPALVLSSAGSLRGGWACRPGSPQTGSQAGTQADRRGPGLPRRDAPEGALRADTGTGALDPTAFRNQGASAKHRTQPAASSKKTPLNESGDPSIAHPNLTEQYEQLRREATSCSEHAAQGLGLALFLRRGMTAWMQAWSQCTDSATPNAHPRQARPAAVPTDLRTQIATLLAGIILGLQQEATS